MPGGLRIAGGINLPSIGLQGRVDLTHTGSGGSLSLESLGTKSPTQMLPLGTFRFMIDIADLPKKILGSNVLGDLAQAAPRSTFYLKRLDLGIGLGTTTFVEVDTRFTIFGSNQDFGLRLGASLSDVSSIVVPLANRIKDLAGDLLAAAHQFVKDNVTRAITETAASFKAGGTAVIDGVVTVGNPIVSGVGQGLATIESGVEKRWKKLESLLCGRDPRRGRRGPRCAAEASRRKTRFAMSAPPTSAPATSAPGTSTPLDADTDDPATLEEGQPAVGEHGGALELSKARLFLPPGAAAARTVIEARNFAPVGDALSDRLELLPDGPTLAGPVSCGQGAESPSSARPSA